MNGRYLIVDPYGQEALATESKEEVRVYLQHLLDNGINIVDFMVIKDDKAVLKTLLLMKTDSI